MRDNVIFLFREATFSEINNRVHQSLDLPISNVCEQLFCILILNLVIFHFGYFLIWLFLNLYDIIVHCFSTGQSISTYIYP